VPEKLTKMEDTHMIPRTVGAILLAAGLVSLAAAPPPDDDRAADRQAIRAHIDRIYQAFIHKDLAELRATHDENWRGFLDESHSIIRGIDGYMKTVSGIEKSPYGMTSYKIRDMDFVFHGDSAFVAFISDDEGNGPTGKLHEVLRLGDYYIKKDGNWIQAGSNTSNHPESIDEQLEMPQSLSEPTRKKLLAARESVWRAYFANDRATLEKLVPEETLTIEPGSDKVGNKLAVLEGAARFAKSGGKLVRLEFPSTEIQCYGNTAILYSTYLYELEKGDQRTPYSGRVTEVFVYRKGQWVNPGWHMDSGK
jgi:ketosteroid isomerase-like protein